MNGQPITNLAAPPYPTAAARLTDVLYDMAFSPDGGDSTSTSSTSCSPFFTSDMALTFTPVNSGALIEIEGCFQLSVDTSSTRGALTVVKSTDTSTPIGYWSTLESGSGAAVTGFFD